MQAVFWKVLTTIESTCKRYLAKHKYRYNKYMSNNLSSTKGILYPYNRVTACRWVDPKIQPQERNLVQWTPILILLKYSFSLNIWKQQDWRTVVLLRYDRFMSRGHTCPSTWGTCQNQQQAPTQTWVKEIADLKESCKNY